MFQSTAQQCLFGSAMADTRREEDLASFPEWNERTYSAGGRNVQHCHALVDEEPRKKQSSFQVS